MRKLVRRFKAGFYIVSDGKAKAVVMGPDNEPVRLRDGRPLGIPNSPKPTATAGIAKKLRACGVID